MLSSAKNKISWRLLQLAQELVLGDWRRQLLVAGVHALDLLFDGVERGRQEAIDAERLTLFR